jgi:hypothetical protein
LGVIKIKPISQELLEVVVRTAKAPLSIKGDTIEYNAASFKVPPGSTVEDLLRKLPGIEVDGSGNIKAQGNDVKKVTVDGKTFFGDDPKAATKNLGAETISKIQVFNRKSDQATITGVDDGSKEKTINLELKDNFKKGEFGKITGAVGTSDRGVLRGNYNRFNKKNSFQSLDMPIISTKRVSIGATMASLKEIILSAVSTMVILVLEVVAMPFILVAMMIC